MEIEEGVADNTLRDDTKMMIILHMIRKPKSIIIV